MAGVDSFRCEGNGCASFGGGRGGTHLNDEGLICGGIVIDDDIDRRGRCVVEGDGSDVKVCLWVGEGLADQERCVGRAAGRIGCHVEKIDGVAIFVAAEDADAVHDAGVVGDKLAEFDPVVGLVVPGDVEAA